MFDKNIFSGRLSTLRSCRHINQDVLAKTIGLSNKAISAMECGTRGASLEIAIALADYFDVSLDYLVGRSDDPARH